MHRRVEKFSASCGRTCVAQEGPPRAFVTGRGALQNQTVFPLSKGLSALRCTAVGYRYKKKENASLVVEVEITVQKSFHLATLKITRSEPCWAR